MTSFAMRSASTQLPADVQQAQREIATQRSADINAACATPAASDCPFTLSEIKASTRPGKDTAPGEDEISYSMIRQSGDVGLGALCTLLNRSWEVGVLPASWKKAVISYFSRIYIA